MLPILTADDYAMTNGVSRGIEELALANRLSATSVMTNMSPWPALAPRLRALRAHVAVGLHLNFTCGRPLTSSRILAPFGSFHALKPLLVLTQTQLLWPSRAAVRHEINAQLKAFSDRVGHLPDYIDGHQHVHALPIIRDALLAEIQDVYDAVPPLVRVPISSTSSTKSRTVATLSRGLHVACNNAEIPTNSDFAGFSNFDRSVSYDREIEAELKAVEHHSGIKIVMCHPGYPDEELRNLDPLTDRRRDELDALMVKPDLPSRIWHPSRDANGPRIKWREHKAAS